MALNLFVIFSTSKSLKSIKACLGFVKTSIIPSPKFESISPKLPTTTPIKPISFLNLFCPSSLDLKAFTTAIIPITKAPIPVPMIAIFKALKPLVAPLTALIIFLIPEIAPPVKLSNFPTTPE